MKKAIVTTTINYPTEALQSYLEIAGHEDWKLYVVGDQKTPHAAYRAFLAAAPFAKYLSPEEQVIKYPELSDAIGWNCIQRRNLGFIEAWKDGADIIATVDDDNIPLDNWGKDIKVGEEIELYEVIAEEPVFDPLRHARHNPYYRRIWHRGYPIQLLTQEKDFTVQKTKITPMVQANLWGGDPDIDAICRIAIRPIVGFENYKLPFTANKPMPFNSQNTILHRRLFPIYFLFPHIGRMDDIWAAYITQHYFPASVIFGETTVRQDRNKHDLVTDLEQEMFGYRYTIDLINNMKNWDSYLPPESLAAYKIYQDCFKVI